MDRIDPITHSAAAAQSAANTTTHDVSVINVNAARYGGSLPELVTRIGPAARALEVHGGSHPLLEPFERSLPTAAAALSQAYGRRGRLQRQRAAALSRRNRARKRLREELGLWSKGAAQHAPTLSELAVKPGRKRGACCRAATAFLDAASELQDALPFQAEMVAALTPEIEATRARSAELADIRARLQTAQADTRLKAAAFNDELRAMARILGKLLGKSHVDYRALLRTKRSRKLQQAPANTQAEATTEVADADGSQVA